jgi:hypothetical protein
MPCSVNGREVIASARLSGVPKRMKIVSRPGEHGSQQTSPAFTQPRALTVNLMEQVCAPKNLLLAYRRVRSNKGKPAWTG